MISQREARRLKKRVAELEGVEESRMRRWATDWPGGTEIARLDCQPISLSAIRTARKLRHAVVVVSDEESATVRFMALPMVKA